MEQNPVSVIKKDFLRNLLKEGKREDGRKFDQYRDLEIDVDFVPRANGSAYVKLGNTKVIAGVKVQVDKPYPDSGDRGNFMTSAEFAIMASPHFEQGPPRIEAIEVARVTDRALRESNIIDMKDLCIEENEKVWGVFVDLEVLDYDGNLFDACSIAALAAVMNGNLPATCPKTGIEVYKEDKPLPLKMENASFNTTFVKIDGHVMVDPSLYEELICDTRVTIGVDTQGAIRGGQKGGFGAFTVQELKDLRAEAHKHHKAIFKQIEKAVKAAA